MPSLRRSVSSPVVRSSPYSNGLVAIRGNGHRRSSGSETASRRVLADIEWWRVADGQCESSSDQESDDHNRGNPDVLTVLTGLAPGADIHIAHVDAGVDHPSTLPSISNETPFPLPTEQFSGLSITPHTPTRRHHRLESSTSSLESTPERAEVPIENLSLRLSHVESNSFDDSLPPLSIHRLNGIGSLSMRPFAVLDFVEDGTANQYADFAVSPLSSAPDFFN